ncbi:MAG: hypothetical protein P8P88_08450 [Polaribacter sp.]|nr:hypothetical protein [Polaribacter sp.]
MKKEITKTKKSKLILQVYHNYVQYHKNLKSFSDRKEIIAWKTELNSKSDYLKDGKLILSKLDYNTDILNCDLIVLNDYNSESEIKALKQVQYFTLIGKVKFEIFQLKKVDNHIELYLLYDYYEIGEPKRDNFKLCNLEMNTPTEIKINGKLDHSLSSGRERTYKEHCYIFHLIGETDEFELARIPFKGSIKQIPNPIKKVDLMRKLY